MKWKLTPVLRAGAGLKETAGKREWGIERGEREREGRRERGEEREGERLGEIEGKNREKGERE